MNERAALSLVGDLVDHAGDDAAVVDGTVVTTDMLHDRTDFPAGTTRYTAGWRAVGASLSDVAATGAEATAAVAVYAAPEFEESELRDFLRGATAVCETVGAEYVGGDLDTHQEFTVATTALGRTDEPVGRAGAEPGDRLCVTGTLGRSGAALRLFEAGETERANELFRFEPRVAAGLALAGHATAMMDSSDGLARSCHQLAEASDCGLALDGDAVPVDDAVQELAGSEATVRELGWYFGEDFELVCTVPADRVEDVRADCPVPLSVVGEVTEAADGEPGDDDPIVTVDGEPLPDRGFTHGE
ncbi:thiamine-phosphate kinase [Haloarchaeobius litoreus]|uniref:Thiamine-monophosphate kinase n=1 Tax=Haloarchaeobius litoreus TaxID=755306 RepID=A0ABD6DNQ0_9EURY|nr:thiamine-phosphate kinase [Haloarchaeobius litoreus]